MAVPHGGDAEAGGEVYIDIAVDVPDVRPQRLLPEDRRLERLRQRARQGVDPRRLQLAQVRRQLAGQRPGRRGDDPRELVAEAHISRRPASDRPSVTSSVYSMSPPTGMPKARRVTLTPRGFSRRAR